GRSNRTLFLLFIDPVITLTLKPNTVGQSLNARVDAPRRLFLNRPAFARDDPLRLKRLKVILSPQMKPVTKFLLLFQLLFTGVTSNLWAQCTVSSAHICVGADDFAYVWINGHPENGGAAVTGVSYGNPVVCITVPSTDLVIGANVIAVQAYNSACCYNWATWGLSIGLSNGSTSYVTSSSGGVQIWNQPTASGPPPPNDSGAVTWWNTGYNSGSVGGWVAPVNVTYP